MCEKRVPQPLCREFKFIRSSKYNGKVLLDDWLEERQNFKFEKFKHNSTNRTDYDEKPCQYNPQSKWENYFRGTGLDRKLLFDYQGRDYLNNFTSSYTLYYGIDSIKNNENPLNTRGNLSNYGLVAYKRWEWMEDKLDPRRTAETTNEVSYKDLEITGPPQFKKPEWLERPCNPITGECLYEKKIHYRCNPPPQVPEIIEMPKMCLKPKDE